MNENKDVNVNKIDANSEDGARIVVVALTFSLVCDCQNTLNMQKYTYSIRNEIQKHQNYNKTSQRAQLLLKDKH